MPTLLQIASIHPDAQARLNASYDLIRAELPAIDAQWLAQNAGKVEGIVTGGHLGAPPSLMTALPNLKVIGINGVGFDKIIADCNKQAAGRYTIVGNLLPSDADGQRDQLVRRLAAQDSGMDLLGMDVTWTAEFAEAGWIQELTGDRAAQATKDTLQKPIDTATWKGKLYGIPRTTNVQLMWYRKSLVPNPPATWDEMMQQAQTLKDQGHLHPVQVSIAKRANVRAALDIARSARTILGANGITLEYPVLRHANNLESVLTYEGTSEVHQLVIGEALTGVSAFR